VNDAIADINSCAYLFLSNIQELDHNGLRLIVEEGRLAGDPQPLRVGETVLSNCTPIAITDQSRAFEIVWKQYVAYSVLNESFASVDDQDRYEGTRFRVYSKSRFIDYISRASFACPEYPGPTQHHEVACEDHIVDVISTTMPAVHRLR
jgi:hypothetical protein